MGRFVIGGQFRVPCDYARIYRRDCGLSRGRTDRCRVSRSSLPPATVHNRSCKPWEHPPFTGTMLSIIWGVPLLASLNLAQATQSPVVDLGYATYQGFYNSTYDLNIFRGYVLDCVLSGNNS
jgi:hypothetical protein